MKIGTKAQRKAMKSSAKQINKRKKRVGKGHSPKGSTSTVGAKIGGKKIKPSWKIKRKYTK